MYTSTFRQVNGTFEYLIRPYGYTCSFNAYTVTRIPSLWGRFNVSALISKSIITARGGSSSDLTQQ